MQSELDKEVSKKDSSSSSSSDDESEELEKLKKDLKESREKVGELGDCNQKLEEQLNTLRIESSSRIEELEETISNLQDRNI